MNTKKAVALVTGAAKGIGFAIVSKLVKKDYFVVLVDIDEKAGAEAMQSFSDENAVFLKADISNEQSVKSLFELVMNKFGRLDAIVNNAGIIRDNVIWKMSMEEFDTVININLRGTWLMCREAAKIMREQKRGRIVNIASRAWLGNIGQSNYSASKAGVVALSRVLALELGPSNVLVNCIAPGLIETPLSMNLNPEVREKLINAQPTKKMGKPEDVANAVVFLLNEDTDFITGQTLYVDGGKSIGSNFS